MKPFEGIFGGPLRQEVLEELAVHPKMVVCPATLERILQRPGRYHELRAILDDLCTWDIIACDDPHIDKYVMKPAHLWVALQGLSYAIAEGYLRQRGVKCPPIFDLFVMHYHEKRLKS